jgi:5-methylcytosine-specific restriction enzyme A
VSEPEYKRLYGTARWKKARKAQLTIEPLCRFHKARGLVALAGVVDHIKPHKGDLELFFDPRNLQSLCKLCHDSAKQAQEKGGLLKGNGLDGLPLDPNHPWNQ